MRDFDAYHIWLGIPPEEQPAHHYKLLGLVPFESDVEVIENAADARMRHVRTFQTGARAALSQTLLNELAAARVCLLNPEKKRAYDAALRQRLSPVVAPPTIVRPPVAHPIATPIMAIPVAAPLAPMQQFAARPKQVAAPSDPVAPAFDEDFTSLAFPARRRRRSKRQSMLGQLAVLAAMLVIIVGSLATYWNRSPVPEATKSARGSSESASTPIAVVPEPMAENDSPTLEPVLATFLSELQPTEIRLFGEAGKDRWAVADGVFSPHALWMHPHSGHNAYQAYDLGGRYRSFSGTAALRDALDRPSNSLLVFRIVGDHRLLWKSQPMFQKQRPQSASIDISGIKKLELFVDCPGSNGWAQAIWLEPQVSTEPAAEASPRRDPPRLELLEATYGAGNQRADVTNYLRGQIVDDCLIAHRFEGMIGSDPAPFQQKFLKLRYRVDGGEEQQQEFRQQAFFAIYAPLKSIPVGQRNGLVILEAGFGSGSVWIDTTEKLKGRVVSDRVDIADADKLHAGQGDPAFGVHKVYYVRYLLDGQERIDHFPGHKISLGR